MRANPEAGPSYASAFGPLLRDWRQRRRLSQMHLALDVGVSGRHLSFLETGRSQPSRDLVLRLAQHLDVPLRERNALLVAAGYAPVFAETPLDSAAMAPVREAIERLLASHEPFPAIVVDRIWNVVNANAAAMEIIGAGLPPALMQPLNAIRVSLHPHGLARRIINLTEWRSHVVGRLRRQAALTGDPELVRLHDEVCSYPGSDALPEPEPVLSAVFVPLRLRHDGRELAFFSTIATFGKPTDVTVAELAIESFFPADAATAAMLREGWNPARPES